MNDEERIEKGLPISEITVWFCSDTYELDFEANKKFCDECGKPMKKLKYKLIEE